jgi:hypothetical protein
VVLVIVLPIISLVLLYRAKIRAINIDILLSRVSIALSLLGFIVLGAVSNWVGFLAGESTSMP